jgi:hypothetical protein
MTTGDEISAENPLLTLCDKQKQLLTKTLGVMLAAFAITFLFTDGLLCLGWLQWVWIVDLAVLIYYKMSYRRAVKHFDSAIETPAEAYCNAKMRQYNALVSGIDVNSVTLVLCPKVWIILVAFAMWIMLFLTLPKMQDLQKDFGSDD